MKSDTYFSTEALTVGYGGRPLIRDITFGLKRGEILTLIGPNGSGKSTILKTLARLLSQIGGVVMLDGTDMRSMSGRDTATRMAVVLTERLRPELMTCGELVASGRYPYTNSFGRLTPHDREVVADALRRVHAEDLYDRDFSEISDGQRQRIMLARAIAQEPEIIVLDEPTSFLDVRHKIELLEILNDMAKNLHVTVVMSLHEIDLASKVSDKIVCVKGDVIAAYGTPDEIFTDDRIAGLYGIAKGSFSAMLGSVELPRPGGEPKTYVIGGAGTGVRVYRALQKAGTPFSAGILFENDVEYPVASALASSLIAVPAFAPIPASAVDEAKRTIDACETVIDCGCPVGAFNAANGELLAFAGAKVRREVFT